MTPENCWKFSILFQGHRPYNVNVAKITVDSKNKETAKCVDKYNFKEKSHNGYIFTRLTKGVYGLPQAGQIAYDSLVQHLEPYGYRPSSKTPVLWTHKSHPINFTLVVNDFGLKYM